jgi:probable rRNA maturation factor
MESTLSIRKTTKRKTLPEAFFLRAKDTILGKQYELSLVLCGPTLSRRYNSTLRGKDRATNILSFPLTDTSGEILLDLTTTKRDAPKFFMNERTCAGFLFIHGLLHLKGYEHGSTMERLEKKYMKLYFPGTKLPYV